MTIARKVVAKFNDVVGPDDPPRDLRAIAVNACIACGMQRDDAVQYAYDNEEKLRQAAIALINRSAARAEPLNFAFNLNDPYFVQGSCYVLPDETDALKSDKQKRANAPDIIKAINSLTDREFEHLCGVFLTCMEVEEPFVTKASGDQGVDFFGKVDFGKFVKGTSELGPVTPKLSVWIVGQAKRVKTTKITTSVIRELVGSVELAKSKISADGGRALTDLTVRVCEPIFYFVVTSGVFTTGSHTLMEEAGVIGFDGNRLAAFLADNGVGLDANQKFDASIFKSSITKLENRIRDPKFA